MQRKICLYIGSMSLGGIGKLMLHLMEEFLDREVAVDLFLMKEGGEYYDEIPKGVQIFVESGSYYKRIKAFVNYLNKEKPHVAISARQRQDMGNILGCFFARSNTRPIVSIHTNLSKENEINPSKTKSDKVVKLFSKLLYKIPKKFIAVSKGVAEDFSKRTGVGQSKIRVIHNPSYKEFSPELDWEWYQQYCNQLPKKKFIIAVGRLTEAKDYPTLIKAFKLVKEKKDIALLILGEGKLRNELENYIVRLSLEKDVFLLGYVNHPQFFLKRAELFVMTSQWEGFGNVIVEALGVGTPVVAANCPSGPSEILENGKYGELVPVGDYEKLKDTIIKNLEKKDHNKNKLIERAKDFSTHKITNEYLTYIFDEE